MSIFERILYWFTAKAEKNAGKQYQKPLMTISDHWLDGAARQPIPGGQEMLTRRFLVIHFTAGWGAKTSIDFWRSPEANGACAHIIIDRDGKITQCRPFNRTCGHAGASKWVDPGTGKIYTGLNANSIGIELANCGDLQRAIYPSTCGPDLSGKPIPRLTARHKNGGSIKEWEVYPQAQLNACAAVAKALVAHYNLDDVVGHDDIAPDRKNDPGPAYPLQVLRNSCGFTSPVARL